MSINGLLNRALEEITMFFDFLLNKNDQTCLAILRQFAHMAVPTLPRQALMDKYDLTNFHLNKDFETINLDLAEVAEEVPSYLDEVVKGTLEAHNVTSYIVQKITLLYIKRANAFPVFEYHFFYDQMYKAKVYRDEHYITQAMFFRYSKQLRSDYQAVNFYEVAGVNQSEEFVIRLRLFQLYYTVFASIEAPFPKLEPTVKAMMSAIKPYLCHPVTPTQRMKLSILLKVWLMRLQNQGTLPKETKITVPHDETYQAIFTALTPNLPAFATLTTNEQDYLYSFLLTQGFVEIDDEKIGAYFPLAVEITERFLSYAKEQRFLKAPDDLTNWPVYSQLLQVNLQFTTFYIEPTTFISAQQIGFFTGLYPVFDVLIRDFIKLLRRELDFQFSERMIVNLYFSYMFTLINTIPETATKDRVCVCVDFSEGTLYSNYVVKSLTAFNHANIVIQRDLDDQTDIYISDCHASDIKVPQVIWLDPPTPQDWSALSDLILTCKQERLENLFPGHQWVGNKGE